MIPLVPMNFLPLVLVWGQYRQREHLLEAEIQKQSLRWIQDRETNKGVPLEVSTGERQQTPMLASYLFPPRNHLKKSSAQDRIDASQAVTPPQSGSEDRRCFHVWCWASPLVFMGIYGFVEWGAVSAEVHSWADKINPDRLLPRGSTCLGSPVTAPAPGVFSPLTATSSHI